jgi:hypothetical protein
MSVMRWDGSPHSRPLKLTGRPWQAIWLPAASKHASAVPSTPWQVAQLLAKMWPPASMERPSSALAEALQPGRFAQRRIAEDHHRQHEGDGSNDNLDLHGSSFLVHCVTTWPAAYAE